MTTISTARSCLPWRAAPGCCATGSPNSSRVYQGHAGELGLALVDALQAPLLAGHRPDLTLVLDLPVAAGMARCAERGAMARFEAKGSCLPRAGPRAGFRLIAEQEPDRFAVVDASADVETVAAAVWRIVAGRFALESP